VKSNYEQGEVQWIVSHRSERESRREELQRSGILLSRKGYRPSLIHLSRGGRSTGEEAFLGHQILLQTAPDQNPLIALLPTGTSSSPGSGLEDTEFLRLNAQFSQTQPLPSYLR